jgi:dienelactone hydrolase
MMAQTNWKDPAALMRRLGRSIKPQIPFTASDTESAKRWQQAAWSALAGQLGFVNLGAAKISAKRLERVKRENYVREKWSLTLTNSRLKSELPVYLLLPEQRARHSVATVLALHGHGYGVKDIVGLWEDGTERLRPDGYHADFACALAQRGFLVAAPEIACFGERQGDYSNLQPGRRPGTCHNVNTYAMMMGGSVAGLRVWEGMRLIDWLIKSISQVDPKRIGVMGISGGGMHAFFSMALDKRIKAGVISGYFCDWKHSILAINHCTCNFIPGLLNLGELSDLAGLIAPRPLLVENGTNDDIFPIEDVKKTVARARRAWRAHSADENLQTDYFEGRHRIHGEKAYDFLAENL